MPCVFKHKLVCKKCSSISFATFLSSENEQTLFCPNCCARKHRTFQKGQYPKKDPNSNTRCVSRKRLQTSDGETDACRSKKRKYPEKVPGSEKIQMPENDSDFQNISVMWNHSLKTKASCAQVPKKKKKLKTWQLSYVYKHKLSCTKCGSISYATFVCSKKKQTLSCPKCCAQFKLRCKC